MVEVSATVRHSNRLGAVPLFSIPLFPDVRVPSTARRPTLDLGSLYSLQIRPREGLESNSFGQNVG